MYRKIEQCRLCASAALTDVLDLGNQSLTGVFPRSREERVTCGPLVLCVCEQCRLLQLRHSYDPDELYGTHYGYRSGLNASMVSHLRAKTDWLKNLVTVAPGELVADIGSNDGTTLSFYPDNVRLYGFDPSAAKFAHYYRKDIRLVTDFFSADQFRQVCGASKAKIVTSIAMFYDLESPQDFANQVASILAPDGVWHFEQSYMPTMLAANAYDTVCHEHLEYYALKQIRWITDAAGLKIVDIQFNNINGGSFAVTAAHAGAPYPECTALIEQILQQEDDLGLASHKPYDAFRQRVMHHRDEIRAMLADFRSRGMKVLGYGASTKGNVVLQHCGISEKDLPCIAEVNETKFGCFTPGTGIPIVSESEARSMKPDVFMVLPWHFRDHIVEREKEFLAQGGQLFFPLPTPQLVKQPLS